MPNDDAFETNRFSVSEPNDLVTEERQIVTPDKAVSTERSQTDLGSIAYELLVLEQRLDAYEQLHREEMDELRKEIERVRRLFLQETNPYIRAIPSTRNTHSHDTNPHLPAVSPARENPLQTMPRSHNPHTQQ